MVTEVIMTEDRAPVSSICSNDDSFVVLERFTEEQTNNESQQNPAAHKSSTSVLSFAPDESLTSDKSKNSQGIPLDMLMQNMKPEEIQKRLHDLIQENLELKETLHQNNLAMKQQFSTLQTWQEEVFKVHKNHKEKFEETKSLILKLMAENRDLKKSQNSNVNGAPNNEEISMVMSENTNLRRQIETLQERIDQLVQREKRLSQPSAKEVELDEVVKHLTRQWELAERSRRQQSIELEHLTAQQTRLQAELAAAQQQLQEQATTKVFVPFSGENDRPAVQQRVQKYQDLMQLLKESVDSESERLASMESWMQLVEPSKPVDNSLRLEINELRKLLSEEQMQSVARKEKLATVFSSFQQLFVDFKNVVDELETLKEAQLTKEMHNNAYDDMQRKGFTEKLDSLTAQLMKKEEDLALSKQQLDSLRECVNFLQLEQKESQDAALSAENKGLALKVRSLTSEISNKDGELDRLSKQLTKLTERIKELEKENDIIPLLRTQVNVYQADFELERTSRAELAGEKERLLQDLRHLQRRNNQLIDDLQAYQEQHFNLAQRSHRNSQERTPSPPKPYEEEVPPPKRYTCPNPECNMVFPRPEPLELHVVDCLHLT